MPKSDADRAREYRQRKRDAHSGENVTDRHETTVCDAPQEVGPLDVYSPQRWTFLQSRGHKWVASKQRAFRKDGPALLMGVTVPGDPAYEGVVQ